METLLRKLISPSEDVPFSAVKSIDEALFKNMDDNYSEQL